MLGPFSDALAGVLEPGHPLRIPSHADDVDSAVGIDIERQIREIVDVVVEEAERPKAVFFPLRPLEPVLAGNDVDMAVAVEIGEGAGLVSAGIEGVGLEWDFVGDLARDGVARDHRKQKQDGSLLHGLPLRVGGRSR